MIVNIFFEFPLSCPLFGFWSKIGVSKIMVPPKSSISIGFSIINHPFWVPVFLETPECQFSGLISCSPFLIIYFLLMAGCWYPTRAPSPPKGFFEKVSRFRQLHRPQNNTTSWNWIFDLPTFLWHQTIRPNPSKFFLFKLIWDTTKNLLQQKGGNNDTSFIPLNLWEFHITNFQMSHVKNPPTFHYTGCLIGILIMVYYNPHITGKFFITYIP